MLIDKTARLIIRLLFGFASDSVLDKLNTNLQIARSGIAAYMPMTVTAILFAVVMTFW